MSNNLTEIEALIKGLNLSRELGINKLVIEGDSQIILNALRKRKTPNWTLNSKLEYALAIVDQFEETNIKHIYREGNREVNNLTNKGADGEEILIRQANMISIS